MAEYIDRKAAISRIKQYCMDAIDGGRYSLDAVDDGIDLVNGIKALPAADVVPVVRCKDCKYYKTSELLPPHKFCFRLRHPTENRSVGYNFAADDFCSHGERKEGKNG